MRNGFTGNDNISSYDSKWGIAINLSESDNSQEVDNSIGDEIGTEARPPTQTVKQ